MTLSATVLLLGIAAGPTPARGGGHPRPLEELPKAPVEIVLPERPSRPAKTTAPAAGGAQAKPTVHILVLPPSLAKPPVQPPAPAPAEQAKASVPLPPPPVLPASGPTAPGGAPPPPAELPKGGEVVASTSALPAERQPGYELVAQKCGRCHGVEKALNAHFSADQWDAYLKKKFRRAGAGISPQQAGEIEAFLRRWATGAGRP